MLTKNPYYYQKIIILFASFFICRGYPSTNADLSKNNTMERAKLHSLNYPKPAPDFFEGAVLGNGAMGVIINTRPDAVVARFGHNNVWDIRIAENNKEKISTFQKIFARVKTIPDTLEKLEDDPWYYSYKNMARENYGKPYPRPFPCGSVILGFDRRQVELIGHHLDISKGLCEVNLLNQGNPIKLQIFTDMEQDRLWMRLVDKSGNPVKNCFNRIKIIPDPSTPKEFPLYQITEKATENLLSFRQILPYLEPDKYDPKKGHPDDRAFCLSVKTNIPFKAASRINWYGIVEQMDSLEKWLSAEKELIVCVDLDQGLKTDLTLNPPDFPTTTFSSFEKRLENSIRKWERFWSKSGIFLDDSFLEEIWYRNLYFLNCAIKKGVTCPGLFANWSYDNIGTAWHGDYHFNYNLQQPFWVTFSSNHLDKHLPYVDLIDFILPMSEKWAKEYYGLRGAYFPHSAYPVEMTMNSYPVPTWGWEICETPWAVQSLWWHYNYSMDTVFLKNRAYLPIKRAVEFLVDYMKRPEASGKAWGDDKYHIFPTVPPELYGLTPGFKYNYDCLVDLTLTKFVFNAFLEATNILRLEEDERSLINNVEDILTHFPNYPTANSAKYGKVFVSVPDEHTEVIYNVPNTLMAVFPGENFGLDSDKETFQILKNTFDNFQVEGGNELVFQHLQAVRLGLLDLEKFKRQVRYCLLPNGTAADMVLQVHGRYSDRSKFDFMAPMGIWFENFSLPVVINECLLQSYNGKIRLFPNWPESQKALFTSLRAVGAFLVSSRFEDGEVLWVNIESEQGKTLEMYNPWPSGARIFQANSEIIITEKMIHLPTKKGETIQLKPI